MLCAVIARMSLPIVPDTSHSDRLHAFCPPKRTSSSVEVIFIDRKCSFGEVMELHICVVLHRSVSSHPPLCGKDILNIADTITAQALGRLLDKVVDEMADEIHFVEVDIATSPDIAQNAGITGTPTVQVRSTLSMVRTAAVSYPVA